MPKSKLRLGRGARPDWDSDNLPSDAPFVVYLGDGRYLGYNARSERVSVPFKRASVFTVLANAESAARMAQECLEYLDARVVPQSQVWRREDR